MNGQKAIGTEDRLRIFILASPKMGGSRLSLLLSRIYDIPQKPIAFDCERIDGERIDKESVRLKDVPSTDCVGRGHLWLNENVIRCLDREKIHVLSIVRHPADAFLSLYHDVNAGKERPVKGWDGMLEGKRLDDESVYAFLERYFYLMFVERSLGWLESGLARIIRYEDLVHHPACALRTLTDEICPAGEGRIEQAVHACFQGPKGRIGEWKDALNEGHLRILRRYDFEIRSLGYSLVAVDPASSHA